MRTWVQHYNSLYSLLGISAYLSGKVYRRYSRSYSLLVQDQKDWRLIHSTKLYSVDHAYVSNYERTPNAIGSDISFFLDILWSSFTIIQSVNCSPVVERVEPWHPAAKMHCFLQLSHRSMPILRVDSLIYIVFPQQNDLRPGVMLF
jgi:hypothetical protein